METETLDKLYLEWSQFTLARTQREYALAKKIKDLIRRLETIKETDPTFAVDRDIESAWQALSDHSLLYP